MIDVLLVARFEVLRAIRTWRAVALIALFAVAGAGGAYNFVQLVGIAEGELADRLGVPRAERPGVMLDQLGDSEMWRNMVEAMAAPEVVDFFLGVPPLALFGLWFGFLLAPFFAASASAECISLDVQSRAIRYEVLRTGRLEIVAGRMLGQLALTGVALLTAMVAIWGVAVWFMVLSDPMGLAAWLGGAAVRTALFSVPFVGFGVAASQITASPAWARVMAVGLTAGSWVLYGLLRMWEADGYLPILVDVMLPLLPQGWLRGMWEPGLGWLASSLAVCALGVLFAGGGYLRFVRRDL